MVGTTHPVERIGAEVLDAQRAEIRAEFEVLRLDLRRLDDAARDLRFDDRRLLLWFIGGDGGRALVASMKPAAAG